MAKVFWSGRSQVVRLPEDFRIDAKEVRIRRRGAAVILEPVPEDWRWLDTLAGAVDADFRHGGAEPPVAEDRPGLDRLFT